MKYHHTITQMEHLIDYEIKAKIIDCPGSSKIIKQQLGCIFDYIFSEVK